MQTKNIIHCENLLKTYKMGDTKINALNHTDFSAQKGELIILSGPSGCGKTTLISVIAGILGCNEGTCTILGHDLTKMSEKNLLQFRAKNIGFVFQQFNLIPTLTVSENVSIPLVINGIELDTAKIKALDVLDHVGLRAYGDYMPQQLSGGQQQRVAIARALIHDPKIIVCDEPTSALDSVNGRNVMQILKSLAKDSQRTLIVVTHDSRIYDFADRIAEMEDGIVFNTYKNNG